MSFSPSEDSRVDVFLHQKVSVSYPDLWMFCKNVLLLSHGQAEVERGLSTNKQVETCNITKEAIIAQRLICDHVRVCGGVTKVPLTKEMVMYCGTARTRYRAYLDEERSKREKDDQRKHRIYWRNLRDSKGRGPHWKYVRVSKRMLTTWQKQQTILLAPK